MLGELRGVTIVTSDLDAACQAYGRFLDYRGEVSRVTDQLAARWEAPSAAGCRMATLRPASGADRFIRFVESAVPAVAPFATAGWIAVELVVQDLAGTAARLADSPFRVIGEPAVLDFAFTDQISAMQVAGPSGEILYLTQIGDDVPGFDLPQAQVPVDRPFIAVLATTQFEATVREYAALAGRDVPGHFTARISAIADALGVDREHRFTLTAMALDNATCIEIDDLSIPPANNRPRSACGLPAGIAFPSFAATDHPAADGLRHGSAGELIELIGA